MFRSYPAPHAIRSQPDVRPEDMCRYPYCAAAATENGYCEPHAIKTADLLDDVRRESEGC